MIGKKLRAYEITDEIGSGGMATVYRAYQPSMDRHVAIKVIRSSILHDPALRERFQREARLIARLEHPHLLPVYDFDGEHDPPYIVMRYLEGGTLKQVRERGTIERHELMFLLRQLAGALDYAHRQGVVHRDLKPSNVMIDREGNAFLTDFGIARATGGDKDLTGTGLMIGTPGYMAPEQAKGDGAIDKGADIYSLGVIAFEALTGTALYDHESGFEVILAHLNEPVPKASERAPGVPKPADAILARALAKKSAERYASATEFVEALTKALKIKPSDAPTGLRSMTQTISVDQLNARRAKAAQTEAPGADTPSDQQRQMTAMSVDVKELAEILYEKGADAERARATMEPLWTTLTGLARQFGGTVHSRAEDVALVLWGRERTREDDSENAIRAALQMREKVLAEARRVLGSGWEPSEESPLPFRAGITTGPVLLERDTASGNYVASGAPITLAVRLKDASPPGEILVAHETFTLVRGVFNFQQREPVRIRGRKEPVDVYVVTQVKPRAFRLRARGIEGVETKMIGREIELRLLQEALTLTLEDGETQVVTVVGEAGVGKSRLLFEFSNWLDLQESTVWFFQARATQPSMLQPYSLARDLFSFRFQILDSDPLAVVHEKFVKGIAGFLGAESERKAHFIGQLVGFDFSGQPVIEAALREGDAFRREAQGYLNELFTTASKTYPVMIHVEDIHWADDRSLDLINNLVRENAELPLFVLCMSRPSLYERRPQWGEGQRFHERIQLEPLSQLSSRRLVRELLKNVPEVPTALRDLVVDRADGNPFYIEELIKALIDDRVIVKGEGAWSVDTTRLSTVRIPATLTGVLQARLDTLPPPLHQLLQRASVMGRVFWDTAVIGLSRETAAQTADEVQAMLEELREREMILRREESGFAGTVEYVFRHAILRDVTYETVIPRQRRALHKLVGDWLMEVGGERAGEHTLLVAEHYARADEPALAAGLLTRAADRALALAALEEGSKLAERALGLLQGTEHAEARVEATLLLGQAESIQAHFAAGAELLEGAVREARSLNNARLEARSLAELARNAMWRGDTAQSLQWAREALEAARRAGDRDELIFSLRMVGNSLCMTEPQEALTYHQESVKLAREGGSPYQQAIGLNSLGITLNLLSRFDEAESAYRGALAINREVGFRGNTAAVLCNMSSMYALTGRLEESERVALESIAVGEAIGSHTPDLTAYASLATVSILRGERSEARRWLRSLAETVRKLQIPTSQLPLYYGLFQIRFGDRARGLAWIGYTRKHEPAHGEMSLVLRNLRELIHAGAPEAEVEAAMVAGESLVLEEILAEAEKD